MDIAALIIAILAFLMASANLVIYLSKHVFSSHTIQLQPVSELVKPEEINADLFQEFDAPSAMDVAFKNKIRKQG
jgi:hypothetical protein